MLLPNEPLSNQRDSRPDAPLHCNLPVANPSLTFRVNMDEMEATMFIGFMGLLVIICFV